MKLKKPTQSWLKDHISDYYVRLAKQYGYRARAAFKLLEIHEKNSIIHQGNTIVDLGAAPGSWSQVARALLQNTGAVFALDILPIQPLAGVHTLQGDFRDEQVLQQFLVLLNNRPVDLVICDMAPNMSGNAVTDQASAFYLAELALEFSCAHLRANGNFLVKVFQGAGFQTFYKKMRPYFNRIVTCKPKASRTHSTEIYLLGKSKIV